MGNEKLVEYLVGTGYLKNKRLIDAFLATPREYFVPDRYNKYAYVDEPLPIGYGQTISAPSMVAIMLELLDLRPKQKILEIGCGSGWNAALMAKMVMPGKVYSTEIQPELVAYAGKNMKKTGIENIEIIESDGSLGLEKHKSYDRIVFSCSIKDIPQELLKQLNINGKLMAPVGNILTIINKTIKGYEKTTHGGCVFVKLRHHT